MTQDIENKFKETTVELAEKIAKTNRTTLELDIDG